MDGCEPLSVLVTGRGKQAERIKAAEELRLKGACFD